MKGNKFRKITALIVAVGITGGIGSLAYFSNQRFMNGEIKLVLGTLDSNITKTIRIEKLDIEVPVSDTFVITNNGTLDQKITFMLNNSSIDTDGLDKINYSLSFESGNGKKIKTHGNGNEALSTLFNKELELLDVNGNEVFLDDGETLTGKLTLNMKRDMPEKYSNADFSFDLNLAYTQTNNEVK